MTSCDQQLASLRGREKRARAPTPLDPSPRQVPPRRRLHSLRSPALHPHPLTIPLRHLPIKTTRILILAACICRSNSRLQHHPHHLSLNHAVSLHHPLSQTTSLLHLHLHHQRPMQARLAQQPQALRLFTATLRFPHLQSATPMPPSRHHPFDTSNPPSRPQMKSPSTRSVPPNVPRSARQKP